MQPRSRNQRPDLRTSLMNMSLVLRLPRDMHLSILFKCPTPALYFVCKVQNPWHVPRETTSEPSKVLRACGVFNVLTWKYALRDNGVHFSII